MPCPYRHVYNEQLVTRLPVDIIGEFISGEEKKEMVEVNGIEPMTSWLQTRRSPN